MCFHVRGIFAHVVFGDLLVAVITMLVTQPWNAAFNLAEFQDPDQKLLHTIPLSIMSREQNDQSS